MTGFKFIFLAIVFMTFAPGAAFADQLSGEVTHADASTSMTDVCEGILHKDQYGLRFGGGSGEDEGICVINKFEEDTVMAKCSIDQYCRVSGKVDYCGDSGECVEIKNISSVEAQVKPLQDRLPHSQNIGSAPFKLVWTDVLEKCDAIYNAQITDKNESLGVFKTLDSATEHRGGDGVRFFSTDKGSNVWQGMELVAAYGVEDCSEGSIASESQCFPVHPPILSFVFKTQSPIDIGPLGGGAFAKHVPLPIAESLGGVSWYDNFPVTLLQHLDQSVGSFENLYEIQCYWFARPKEG